MAQQIEVQLLGTPHIKVDGEAIFFSFNKVNALVYYLLMQGTVMRDELSGLLWPDKSDAIARKNLRNAIYEAKKILGTDTLISPRKAVLMVNPRISISFDVATFKENPKEHLELYRGDFLQGFYVKDSYEYEDWYLSMRHQLRSLYMEAIKDYVEDAFQRQDYAGVERYGRRLIEYNPYEENYYALLLKAYCKRGKTQAALNLYEELRQLFQRDLQMDPPPILQEIINESLLQTMTPQPAEAAQYAIPLGRKAELEQLLTHTWNFIREQDTRGFLILGATGSGKSALKDSLLERVSDQINVIQTNCYQVEKNFLLRPWLGILEDLVSLLPNRKEVHTELQRLQRWFPQVGLETASPIRLIEMQDTLKIDAIFHTIASILEAAAKEKKLLIIFEDLHWMDSLSYSLLSALLLRKVSKRVMFLLTSWDTKEKDFQHFLSTISQYNRIETCELQPFTTSDIHTLLVESNLPLPITDDLVQQVQEQTNGNLFFLEECLTALRTKGHFNELSTNMHTLFKSIWVHLNEEEEKILTFVSFFYNGAPLSMIAEYMELNHLQLLDRLEILEDQHLIIPVHHLTEISYQIAQHKMKEFIHQEVSSEKWKVLHAYLGEAWEKKLTDTALDINIYPHLVYHFDQSGDLLRMARYKLKHIMYFLNFSHELFPVLGSVDSFPENSKSNYFTEVDTLRYIEELGDTLSQLRRLYGVIKEVKELELAYLHLKGRYFIREGRYEDGLQHIHDLIEQSYELRSRDYMLMGYKQMIYYDIQMANVEDMKKYIELALDLAVECNYHKEVGILLRLKGLNMIMEGNFADAERLLQESIATFMVTQNVARRYALNIAAAYNYLGEIRSGQGAYEEALSYFEKALETSMEQAAYSSWMVFSCNAGLAAWCLGRSALAKEYLERAETLFKTYDFYWRRPIVESLLTLIHLQEGREEEAQRYLESALQYVQLMKNPQELGYVHMLLAIIKGRYATSNIAGSLDKPASYYAHLALSQLQPYRDSWAREQIQSFLQ